MVEESVEIGVDDTAATTNLYIATFYPTCQWLSILSYYSSPSSTTQPMQQFGRE